MGNLKQETFLNVNMIKTCFLYKVLSVNTILYWKKNIFERGFKKLLAAKLDSLSYYLQIIPEKVYAIIASTQNTLGS